MTFNRAIEMSQSWHRALGMLGDLFMKYLEADAVTWFLQSWKGGVNGLLICNWGLQQIEINSELKYDTSGVLPGKLGKVPSNWRSLSLLLPMTAA